MNANQIKAQLAQVFENDYPGYECFVEKVINLIFTGDDTYEAFQSAEDLTTDEKRRRKATESGILKILKVGEIDAPVPIEVFDITLSDDKDLQYNRVGIQSFIRSDLFVFTNAFMLFHNENPEGKDWRFSFAYKDTTIKGMTPAKRYTYLFGKNHRARTASERFAKLADAEKDTQNLLNAFSVEALSKDFFNGYKEQYKAFCDFLFAHKDDREYFGPKFSQWEDKYLRDYVKKMMGRITFIYFLQRKGWMNGDLDYMQKAFENSTCKDDYLDSFLEPLFCGVLNTKPEERAELFMSLGWNLSLLDGWNDIPYLNGGLFERDEQDKPKSKFPALMFKNLFDFYSRYNFTIYENDPDDAEVGIDPEMLGHIFENLLEDNKDKGAFYTPKEIVQYMSRESISQYLKTHTDEALHTAIDELIKDGKVGEALQDKANATAIYRLLCDVKVCDPAIGSGAFPMGVLNVLYHARMLLYAFTRPTQGFSPAMVKREIIQNNIYGVDIEKGAVDIARLRFWLALVVDEEEPQPLPNLDYKIMCGNSLIHRFALDAPFQDVLKHYNKENKTNITLDDYRQWVYDYTNLSDHTQKDNFRQKIEEIKHAFKTVLSKKEKDKISNTRGEIDNLQYKDIFGNQKGSAAEIKKMQKKLKDLEAQRDDIEANKLYENAFEWRFEFPALLDEDGNFTGFDVVIGNPPYLRIQGIRESNPKLADYITNNYSSATGSFDLYITFAERGLNLIKRDGIVNYIMPTKWTNSAFGKGFRKFVSEIKSAYKIINFGAYQVFNASTYTGLQWFKPNSKFLQYYELNKDLTSNEELKRYLDGLSEEQANIINLEKVSGSQWVLTNNAISEILNKLEQHPRRIKDVFDKIFQGLATSKDDVYFIYDCNINDDFIIGESKQLGRKVQIEKGLVKPLLKGEDVHRYDTIKTDRYVIFPYKILNGKAYLYSESELSEQFPRGYTYLKECEEILREREHGRLRDDDYWYRYIYPKNLVLFDNEKLVAPEISLGGNFAYDKNGEFYSTTKIYGYIKKDSVKESYKFWLALFNSRLFWFFIQNTGYVLRGGYYTFKTDYVNPFPVPKEISKEIEKAITILVDYIITIKSLPNDIMVDEYVEKDAIIRQFENIIDALLYELYFPVEFKQVDISFVDPVLSSFTPIDSKNNQEAVDTIRISFAQFRDMNNRIRNNLKYMSIKLESLLAPIINI